MDNPKQLRPKIQVKTATQLRAAIDAANFLSTIKAKGHADIHVQQSDIDSMERLLSRDTSDSSTFPDADIADYCINETLYQNANQIETWLANNANTELQPLHANFDPELSDAACTGHGFAMDKSTKTIKEYEAHDATVILRKDRTNGYGFTMVTAYPNITTDEAVPTGRDIRDIVRQTPTYQKASPLGKTHLEHRCNPASDFEMKHFLPIAGKPEALRFSIPTDDPKIEHVVTITESGASMTTKREGVKTASDFTNLSVKPYGQSDIKDDVDLNDPIVWKAFSSKFPKYAEKIKEVQTIANINTPEQPAIDNRMRFALLAHQQSGKHSIGATFQKGDRPGTDQLSMRIPIDVTTGKPIDDPTKTDTFHFVNIRSTGVSIATRRGREYVDSEFAKPSQGQKFTFLNKPGMWEKFSEIYPEHAAAVTSLQTEIKKQIPNATEPLGKTQEQNTPTAAPKSMVDIYESYRKNPERGIFVRYKSDPESDKQWLNLYIPVDKNDMSRVVHSKATDTQHILHIYPNRMTISTLSNHEFIPSNLTDIQSQYIPESSGNNKVYLNDDQRIWQDFERLYPKHAAVATKLQSQMQQIPELMQQANASVKSTSSIQQPVTHAEPEPAVAPPTSTDKATRIARAENLANSLNWSSEQTSVDYSHN